MLRGNGIWAEVDELIALKAFAGQIFKRAEKKSSSPLAGGYASPFRGRGIDFSEVREYQPGDDIRSIDWRVTARTGTPHTKLYIEERERPVFFILDFKPSMFFGTRQAFKSVVMCYLSALLAWAATGHGDRVGGLLYGSDDLVFLKPLSGKRGLLRFINMISLWSKKIPDSYPNIAFNDEAVIRRAKSLIRPGSLVYILSDFRTISEDFERQLNSLARHCDVVAINIADHLERNPPAHNQLRISDGKQSATIDTSTKASVFKLRSQHESRLKRFESLCSRHGIHSLVCYTDDEWAEVLRQGLAVRHHNSKSAIR
ncbi:MAG: DUF58 domain-containing protein [Gammaproteobacteria bacterium]|nr:DUF58 domain-containing protein [Gammaproteobacteria bacterium]